MKDEKNIYNKMIKLVFSNLTIFLKDLRVVQRYKLTGKATVKAL